MDRRWQRRIKLKRFSAIAITAIVIILSLFAWFTIYGTKVGNFVISIDKKEINLALSEKSDLSNKKERITYPGVANLANVTFADIPDNLSEGDGVKTKGSSYLCYSFYLINLSSRSVDYDFDFNLLDFDEGLLSILRVMIIEGEGDNTVSNVYALPEASEENERKLEEELAKHVPYTTKKMERAKIAFSIKGKDLGVEKSQKFTVVMWIEGCDPECVDDKIGTNLKAEIKITGK